MSFSGQMTQGDAGAGGSERESVAEERGAGLVANSRGNLWGGSGYRREDSLFGDGLCAGLLVDVIVDVGIFEGKEYALRGILE